MIHKTIDFTTRFHERQEFLETVAASIEFRLGLPDGRALVGMIGNGHERSNHDALISWITNHWDWERELDARRASEKLADQLEDLLTNLC